MSKPIIVIKANGEREEFIEEKLLSSLTRAGANRDIAEDILVLIKRKLYDGITTREIYQRAFKLLKKKNLPTASRYSIRRALADMGPSGYPFEELVAEIYRANGYTAQRGVTLQGHCVAHEIDVVAWDEKELVMIEAKFHNAYNTKTDVQTSLYVKARFDDLAEGEYTFGNHSKITKGKLYTNTKFTKDARQYAECQNIEIIGWNYPQTGNLQDQIDKAGLHPITVLTTLSSSQKHRLLNDGVVLCRHLTENPDMLEMLGLSRKKIDTTLHEIRSICGDAHST